eukprot:CAMPEP_0174260762 /NCGR_PEP_ID=MMETSP0439-20130205/10468_1 /TAXON_ID=0 /ORGANISM="Stereomyxa ramosa, Strain Chinc5" /LENGTH=121 /DNA_ID=CAMNT_0015345083 /DNA_START=135 /DNA_END=500 /DNA_ORIENTATION=-
MTANKWTILRIFADDEGETHFGTKTIELENNGDIGSLSELIALKGCKLRHTPNTYDFEWHNAPAKQFIVNLNAAVEVEVSSGDKKVIKQGEVFLVEDVTGKGHRSKAVNNQERFSLFLPLE